MQQFGLIGKKLAHSFSKRYFEQKFKKEKITNASYDLFELPEIKSLDLLLKSNKQVLGLNVTIPYKTAVIPYLDDISEEAKAIAAVNTIKVKRTPDSYYLKGYNTDVIGFKKSLYPFLEKEHHPALIFGTGGAAKAVAFVLKQLEIPFYFVSRNAERKLQTIQYEDLDKKAIEAFPFLINCTPLGMEPLQNERPPISMDGIGKHHLVYDLIYNPEESIFLSIAKAKGAMTINGLSMLRIQADEAWKIWQHK